MSTSANVPIGFHSHDHSSCVSEGILAARKACESSGLRLTKVRERVLEILLQEHRALGAYAVLERLNDEGLGSKPPIAYRALDFLVAHGFAHRIERLNAFVACMHPGQAHVPAFLICKDCKNVAEAASDPVRPALQRMVDGADFKMDSAVIEVTGVCPNCKAAQ